MALFDPSLLACHGTVVSPSEREAVRCLSVLDNLKRIRDDGTLYALSETRVEQSFNERLFAEVFGYRTLLRDGAAEYHLQPKEYSSASGKYDDFSLGFFGPGGGLRVVSAELKGPAINLDAPQTSRTDKATPVQQAHQAAAGEPSIRWVIVSNYDEMRLYRAGDQTAFERVVLTELDTLDDFRRAYAIFGRASLLGSDVESASPLEQLWDERSRAMLDPAVGCVRLVHEASVSTLKLDELRATPAPLHAIDDALRAVQAEVFGLFMDGKVPYSPALPAEYRMKLTDGKLRTKHQIDDHQGLLIEASPAGALRFWEHAGWTSSAKVPYLQANDVAVRMAWFVHFAGKVLHRGCATDIVRFRWTLRDLDGAVLGYPLGWAAGAGTLVATATTSAAPWMSVDFSRKADKKTLLQLLSAVRELLFPFEREAIGGIVRLAPSLDALVNVVGPSVVAALGVEQPTP